MTNAEATKLENLFNKLTKALDLEYDADTYPSGVGFFYSRKKGYICSIYRGYEEAAKMWLHEVKNKPPSYLSDLEKELSE
jgi:hypothetical protein